jgi:glycerophosphoryl diester phosphodiesterase
MIVIGHRGAAGLAPEHTFASWDLALEAGADYLEQDLQMTADGVLIVLHDDSLDRTAHGPACRGEIRQRTWDEIRECDVGTWFNEAHPERARPEFAGQRIPTLDAVLQRYKDRARFYIETKDPDAAPGMEDELIRLLRRHDLLPLRHGDDRVIIQSFSDSSLLRIHRLEPELPLVLLFGRHMFGGSIRRRLQRTAAWATGIGPQKDRVDRKLLDAAHALGLVVHPWTVNEPADLERLLTLGVDGVFTDFPDRAISIRGRSPQQV